MKKEIINFIEANNLSPFNKYKTQIKKENNSIFKTSDAKSVHNKVLSLISNNFCFADTSNIFNYFNFTQDKNEIKKRQDFFKSITKTDNSFLKSIQKLKPCWKPKYGIIVVTEDEKTFSHLKELSCPVKFLISMDDAEELEKYDIVQVLECENFNPVLERLPQTVFLNSIDEAYLERYVELLSSWKENIELIEKNKTNQEIEKIIMELKPLFYLFNKSPLAIISKKEIEDNLETINQGISLKLKEMNFSGEKLFEILSMGKLPLEVEKIISSEIKKTGVPENIFNISIPVTIDEAELEKMIRLQSSNEFTDIAKSIKKHSKELKQVPGKLEELANLLIGFDFESGISNFTNSSNFFPDASDWLRIEDSCNIFLERPKPISFYLNEEYRCSILTGANSGGKTTLLEHILQLISLFQLGLSVNGNVKMPIFSEIYYFAKNKGSASKGAFETLLTQMSKIRPGTQTLILADEIEAVTEPGAAGKIVASSADYFIKQNCFLVIATHLGQEIEKMLPQRARIDGIEAKGLDENFELIVEHNPVLGKLANSTPELIVEKMAISQKSDYFNYIHNYIKNQKND